MKKFLQSWIISTLAVLVAVYLERHIHYQRWVDLLAASLILGILNTLVRPLLMILTLPIVILTLGLFRFVINALLLYFVGFLLRPHFYVDSFQDAFWGALIISLVSVVLNTLTGTGESRVRVQHRSRPPDSGPDSGGSGPVIDV
jgi:putative membrane protein